MLAKTFMYFVRHRWELIRFIIVGLVTFGLNLLMVWLFYGKVALDYRMAVSYAYFITVVAHFLLNRTFTYRHKAGSVAHATAKYFLMLFVNYGLTFSISTATVEYLRLTPYHGVIFSTFGTALSSFLLMKHFVFVQKEYVK